MFPRKPKQWLGLTLKMLLMLASLIYAGPYIMLIPGINLVSWNGLSLSSVLALLAGSLLGEYIFDDWLKLHVD